MAQTKKGAAINMGNIASPEPMPAKSSARQIPERLLEIIFPLATSAIFTAAALLFWVQPMVGKLVLPLMGGTPAVWAATLLFFQTALLLGYLYAHAIGHFLPLRAQVIVHMGVLLLATLALPIGIPAGIQPPADSMPVLWLFGLFAATVGAPYTALAATSPLLQRWFSMSGHPAAANPYQLYVASNVGSLVGLLGYPLLIEPLAGTSLQTVLWSTGFLVLALMIGFAALALQVRPQTAQAQANTSTARITAFDRFRWVALSFVPSSLLLGVTTHITTDIAAMPLLWAFPLALYLLTFIIAFADRPLISRPILLKVETLAIVLLAAMMWFKVATAVGLAVSLFAFFVIALMRHSDLVETKPPAGNLTEFYLWMSFGGALGGVFNAIVAPIAFDTVAEYPLTLAAAAFTRLLMVPASERWSFSRYDFVLPAVTVLAVASMHVFSYDFSQLPLIVMALAIGLMSFAVYVFQDRPWRFALGLSCVLALLIGRFDSALMYQARSFFGTYRVHLQTDINQIILSHGTTIHGAQRIGEARPTPLTYYAKEGPMGQALIALRGLSPSLRFGVVGMGSGASACYSTPTDTWTFYEIDPLVVTIARDHGTFRFLSECTPNARIVTGDARLSLVNEPNAAFDILILDAFSSDAIPTHLMTREALELARAKLAPDGVILFNISNRYLKLEPVVANTARAAGLSGISQLFQASEEQSEQMITSSHWIALSNNKAALARIAENGKWQTLKPDPTSPVWTDDYSSLMGVVSIK
jgi:hypothetical protein